MHANNGIASLIHHFDFYSEIEERVPIISVQKEKKRQNCDTNHSYS